MPLQVLAEKMRQTLGVDGRHFQPISLERYKQTLGDAARFADWIEQYRRTAGDLEQSIQRFFTATTSAIQDCPLPAFYSERFDTHELRALPPPPLPQQYTHLANVPTLSPNTAGFNSSAGSGFNPDSAGPIKYGEVEANPGFNNALGSVGSNQRGLAPGSNGLGSSPGPNPKPTRYQEGITHQGLAPSSASRVEGGGARVEGLETLSNRFADKVQWLLMVPLDLWMHAFRDAKARLTALDTLRLRVDAQRRKVERRSRHFIEVHHKHHSGRHSNLPGGSSSSNAIPGRSPRAAAAAAAPATSSDSFVAGTLETSRPSGGRDNSAAAAAAVELAGGLDRGDRDREDVFGDEESPESDDEESWAEAVYRRRGEPGLLAAHEMVERKLQPLLSEFSGAEMVLSALLGWLVTEAARLRAYITHLLITGAGHVDDWQLPPGLLEPFPTEIVPLDAIAAAALQSTAPAAAAAPCGPVEHLKQRSITSTTQPTAAAAAAVPDLLRGPSLGSDFRSFSGREYPATAAAAAAAGGDIYGADSLVSRGSQGSPAADAAAANTAATTAAAREAVFAAGGSGNGAEAGGSAVLDAPQRFQQQSEQPISTEDQILNHERSKIKDLFDNMRISDLRDSAASNVYVTPDSSLHSGYASPAAGWRSPVAPAAAAALPSGISGSSSNGADGISSRGINLGPDHTPAAQDLEFPVAAAAPPAAMSDLAAGSTGRPADFATAEASDLPRSLAAAPVAGAVAAALMSLDRDRAAAAPAATSNLGLGAPRDLDLEPVRSSDVAAAAPAADLPASLATPVPAEADWWPAATATHERPNLASVAAAALSDLPKSVAPTPAAGAAATALLSHDRDRQVPSAGDNLGLGAPRDIDLQPVTSADVAAAAPAADLPYSLAAAPATGAVASQGLSGDDNAAPAAFVAPAGAAAAAGGFDTESRPTLDLRNSSRELPEAPTAAQAEVIPPSYLATNTNRLVTPLPPPPAAAAAAAAESAAGDPELLYDSRSPSPLSPAVAAIQAATRGAAAPHRTSSSTSTSAAATAGTPTVSFSATSRPYQVPPSTPTNTTRNPGSFSSPSAAPPALPYLQTDRALLNALGTETGREIVGSDSPHAAVGKERKGLLARVAELEQEHAGHAASAAQAGRFRTGAETRAREIDSRLMMEVPSEKQRLMQQQEAAAAELAQVRSRHAAVGEVVNRLKAELGGLVQQQQELMTQSLTVSDERRALELSRDRLATHINGLSAQADELRGREAISDRDFTGRQEELERMQLQVSDAEAALAAADGERQQARTRLHHAQSELEQVEAEASNLESQRLPLQQQLDKIERQDLPEVTTAIADINTEQQRLRQQEVPSLETTVKELKAEEQQKGALAQDLRNRAAFAGNSIVDVDHECEHLACQEVSFKAQATRAQAAHQAETARLQAAEAEAKGLKDAAGSLTFYHKMAAAAKAAAAKVGATTGPRTTAGTVPAAAAAAAVAAAAAPASADALREAATPQPRSTELVPAADLASAAGKAPADLDGATSADQPPGPSHDAELPRDASMTNGAELAPESDQPREAEAYKIAQEKGISLDTARRIVGLPVRGFSTATAAAAPGAQGAAAAADQEAGTTAVAPAAAAGATGQVLPRATTTPASSGRASTESIHRGRTSSDLPRSDTVPSPRKHKTSIFHPIDTMKQLLKRQQLRKKWRLGTTPLGGAPDEPPEVEEIVTTHQGTGVQGLPDLGVRDQGLGRSDPEAAVSPEIESASSSRAAAAGAAEGAEGDATAEAAGTDPAAAVPLGPLAAAGSSSWREPLEATSIGSNKASSQARGTRDQYPTPAAAPAGGAVAVPQIGAVSSRADVGAHSHRRDQYMLQDPQQPLFSDSGIKGSKRQSSKYGQYVPEYEQQYLPSYAPAAAAPGSSGSGAGGEGVDEGGVYKALGPLEAAGDVGYDLPGAKHGSRRHRSASGRYY